MKSMKLLFISTHFIPDYHYGGVVESSSGLFKYLRKLANFSISCVSKNPDAVKKYIPAGNHCYKSLFFHRFGFSLDAIFGLWRDVKKSDAVLINGIFTFPVTLAQIYSVFFKKPFIVAVRGGLQPWSIAHKKLKKHFYIKFITIPLMKRAKYIHVTSLEEEKNIKAMGINKTINVSNGIDADIFNTLPDKYSFKRKYDGKFIFLFMSRMDKEKGLDILFEAYRKFCSQFVKDKHILLLVGPDNQNYLKRMSINYKKENIEYINGVYGNDKIKLIRRADVVLLPSYSENFGNIVAEALACERPVITTTGTPWKNIGMVGCGNCIKPNPEYLLEAMIKIYSKNDKELKIMGDKGREYILKNFRWDLKAQELYKYLVSLSN